MFASLEERSWDDMSEAERKEYTRMKLLKEGKISKYFLPSPSPCIRIVPSPALPLAEPVQTTLTDYYLSQKRIPTSHNTKTNESKRQFVHTQTTLDKFITKPNVVHTPQVANRKKHVFQCFFYGGVVKRTPTLLLLHDALLKSLSGYGKNVLLVIYEDDRKHQLKPRDCEKTTLVYHNQTNGCRAWAFRPSTTPDALLVKHQVAQFVRQANIDLVCWDFIFLPDSMWWYKIVPHCEYVITWDDTLFETKQQDSLAHIKNWPRELKTCFDNYWRWFPHLKSKNQHRLTWLGHIHIQSSLFNPSSLTQQWLHSFQSYQMDVINGNELKHVQQKIVYLNAFVPSQTNQNESERIKKQVEFIRQQCDQLFCNMV